jgi:hypothetical protein
VSAQDGDLVTQHLSAGYGVAWGGTHTRLPLDHVMHPSVALINVNEGLTVHSGSQTATSRQPHRRSYGVLGCVERWWRPEGGPLWRVVILLRMEAGGPVRLAGTP